MREIKVLCTNQGTVEITTTGFRGKACLRAVEGLSKALGAETVETTPTEEMNLAEETGREGRHVEQ